MALDSEVTPAPYASPTIALPSGGPDFFCDVSCAKAKVEILTAAANNIALNFIFNIFSKSTN
jgi:hypothetical protein